MQFWQRKMQWNVLYEDCTTSLWHQAQYQLLMLHKKNLKYLYQFNLKNESTAYNTEILLKSLSQMTTCFANGHDQVPRVCTQHAMSNDGTNIVRSITLREA